jgi:DNA repair exonuclease SbcCD ATPase subunit
MRITRIEIENWRCFRGKHSVDLDSGAHAIVARHETDPDRSNWLGKSTFLWAPRFAQTGERPKDCPTEDDWITRGEDFGSVATTYSDGTRIERSRKRGGPTNLVVRHDGKEFRKAEAQAEIERIVGLSEKDADIWFLVQKNFDKFVATMRPSDRAREVSEWLRIEPLQRAEADVRSSLSDLFDRESKLAAKERADRDLLASLLSRSGIDTGCSIPGAIELLAEIATSNEAIAKQMSTTIEKAEAEQRTLARYAVDRERATEREELAREVERARVEAERLAGAPAGGRRFLRMQQFARDASDEASRLQRIARDKQTLAHGEFDGTCPVGGQVCPVTKELNAKRMENEAAARQAAKEASEARDRSDRARRELDAMEAQRRAAERAKERHAALASRLERSKSVDVPAFDENRTQVLDGLLRDAKARRDEARDRSRDAKNAIDEVQRIGKRIEDAVRELTTIKDSIRTKREAVEILGRRGAQRRIAEGVLQEVEEGANVLLLRAGIGLSIRFRWDRETGSLATTCDVCGAPFPASTRVKECARCDAPRGPKIDERLDVVLSDRSGAADDLAGLAISLSVSSMLRAERGSAWGVVCLDEPFAALDRANRKNLARGLISALAFQWEQALVIAHDDATMDGMPNRIVITGGPNGSKVERV